VREQLESPERGDDLTDAPFDRGGVTDVGDHRKHAAGSVGRHRPGRPIEGDAVTGIVSPSHSATTV
jgi:hypothetical protein